MGNKYMETKESSLESSVLGVWKVAIEENDARETAVVDGRTKSYKEHRAKLETARTRREDKKVNKEEVELDEGGMKRGKDLKTFKPKPKKEDSDLDEMNSLTDEELDQITDEEIDLFELDDEMFEDVMKKKSAGDRKAAAKKKAKWAKTSGGKKAALKSKKRAAKVRSGTVKVDKSKSKVAKKRAKLYSGNDRNLPNMGEALMQIRAEKQDLDEASGDKEAYKKFFDAALKKFKVSSPAELEGDQKKKFYDYIDAGWEADNEKAEAAMSQVREFKIQSMKAALAQIWGMEEGKNPFKKEDDEEEMKKKVKTETGKKAAVIDINPKIAD